ncbi:MAG: DNA primase, partial [Flavobacteriales bacterium CG_4_9_14_3_um_filter_32_8]
TAKKAITQEDTCYLVEGYTDVISLYQAGVENVVASSGTSLTEGQIRLIKRFTENVTILYDGDAAGLKASFRGIDMILKEGMNVRVVLFPQGEDPDSYAKNHTSEELKTYITTNAQDFIRFKTSVLIKEVGDDPIKKAELIKDIVNSISNIPDQIKRSVYTKECSSLLEISEQALINETNKILRKNFSNHTNQPISEIEIDYEVENQEKKENVVDELMHWERETIRLLITFGEEMIKVDAIDENEETVSKEISVAFYMISSINSDNIKFENATYQKIADFYTEKINNEEMPTHQHFINHSDSDISQLAINIFTNQYELSPNWEKHKIYPITEDKQLKKAIFNTLFAFKKSKLRRLIIENQEKIKNESSQEILNQLIQEQINLKKIDQQLATKLGRVV